MKKTHFKPLSLAIIAAMGIAGCSSSDNDKASPDFTLQLLHAADIDGSTGALGNVENFSSILNALKAQHPDNTLIVSSGDNFIPGPRYLAASDSAMNNVPGVNVPGVARGDIAFLNAMGFQASAMGNHDLDGGTSEFASIIRADSADADDGQFFDYPGSSFPYLSANLNFAADSRLASLVVENGQEASANGGKLAASSVVTINGEKIGIVGATTPTLDSITNTGDIEITTSENTPAAIAASIQPAIDALVDQGINKIVVLAHMQLISVEKALAPLLRNVDIIVAGGSNTIFADNNDVLHTGDSAAEDYPLQYTNASGDPILVVNTDGDYKYLGRLVVTFDGNGVLKTSSLDNQVNGAYASTDAVASNLGGSVNPFVGTVTAALNGVLQSKDGNILGITNVFLEGRRSFVRNEETNLGNLTADANLFIAKQYDSSVQISIKNGGGIRDDIGEIYVAPGSTDAPQYLPPSANTAVGKPAGGISQLDIESALRFNNKLTLLTITNADLKNVLEHAVSRAGETSGRFPQIGGFRFTYDDQGTAIVIAEDGTITTQGQRIKDVFLLNSDGSDGTQIYQNGALVSGQQASGTLRLVTLSFLAGSSGPLGGDGYPWTFPHTNRLDLDDQAIPAGGNNNATFTVAGSEQDALAEYLKANFADAANAYNVAETAAGSDTRIREVN